MYTEDDLIKLNHVIMGIFEAEDFESLSDAVMSRLPDLITHEKSFFAYNTIGLKKRTVIRSLTIDEERLRQYTDYFVKFDYTGWYLNQQHVHVYRDSDIVSQSTIDASQVYREWLIPMGMKYVCGNVVRDGRVRFFDFTLLRSEPCGDFTDNELFLLKLVTDQLQLWYQKHYSKARHTLSSSESPKKVTRLPITQRELEVAELICSGFTAKEVSQQLGIAYGTTRRHIANIYEKLGISSRIELINRCR